MRGKEEKDPKPIKEEYAFKSYRTSPPNLDGARGKKNPEAPKPELS